MLYPIFLLADPGLSAFYLYLLFCLIKKVAKKSRQNEAPPAQVPRAPRRFVMPPHWIYDCRIDELT